MSLDVQGKRAADALRSETAGLDVETRLASLHRLDRQRSLHRRVGAVATFVLIAVVALVLTSQAGRPRSTPPQPLLPPSEPAFPALGDGYDVVNAAVSPSGQMEAVATLRAGKAAVVLVRRADEREQDVVWSARTPQEVGKENVSRPVSVAWAPDEHQLAFLIAQVPFGQTSSREVLTLLTVSTDGSGRRVIADTVGSCECDAALPTLSWSPDGRRIEVVVPNDTGPGRYDVALP